MIKKLLTTIGLTLVISITACAKNTPAPVPSGGPTAGNQGATKLDAQAIYKQNCVSCHAVDLSGGAGPNLQKVGAKLSPDQISNQISNGGVGMPPFKGTLKTEEINALAQWLALNK